MWYLLKVKTGAEFKIHDLLTDNNIEVYSPYEKKAVRRSKQQKKSRVRINYILPVLLGYLLINIDDFTEIYDLISKYSNVYGLLYDGTSPYRLHDSVIDELKEIYPVGYKTGKLKNSIEQIKPRYKKNDILKIDSGPFSGLQISVLSVTDSNLIGNLQILGASRAVTVALDEIRLNK